MYKRQAQDDENQRKWGILQYYEKVDKTATENQIKQRGDALSVSYTHLDVYKRQEQDINTLHTFTALKDYSFSKNRVIRTIDQ